MLHDHVNPPTLSKWFPPASASNPEVIEYVTRAKNIFRQLRYQALGEGSGAHALYHRFVFLHMGNSYLEFKNF